MNLYQTNPIYLIHMGLHSSLIMQANQNRIWKAFSALHYKFEKFNLFRIEKRETKFSGFLSVNVII